MQENRLTKVLEPIHVSKLNLLTDQDRPADSTYGKNKFGQNLKADRLLGEKRAKAAEKYLVTMGVAADRISTISYGKEKPADTGHDEAAWAKNRRDEFVLQSK